MSTAGGATHATRQRKRTAARLVGAVAVLALALWASPVLVAGTGRRVIALAPQDIHWFTPAYYTDGRQRAQLLGDSSKSGAWIDRVKIPGGSRVLTHTHPDDEVVTVIEGTWYLGIGEKFDEAKLKAYPPGSFVIIPAHVPHFVATRDDPVVVQVSGDGVFRTEYLEKQPRS